MGKDLKTKCAFPQDEKISDSNVGEVWVHDTLGILYMKMLFHTIPC